MVPNFIPLAWYDLEMGFEKALIFVNTLQNAFFRVLGKPQVKNRFLGRKVDFPESSENVF